MQFLRLDFCNGKSAREKCRVEKVVVFIVRVKQRDFDNCPLIVQSADLLLERNFCHFSFCQENYFAWSYKSHIIMLV